MPDFLLNIEIDEAATRAALDELEKEFDKRVSKVIGKLLTTVEEIQIKRYTSGSNPELPPGSRYVRRFELRDSSRKEIGRTRGNTLTGRWYTDLSSARYVLGPLAEQAPLHRGRWLSTEDVEQKLDELAPAIIKKEVDR